MRVYIHVQDLYMTVVAKKENVLFSFIEQFEWRDDSLAQNLPERKVKDGQNELLRAREEIIIFQWHH